MPQLRRLAASVLISTLASTTLARAQTPPANEPPARLEATAQAALLATTGNTSTQSLGFGGDMTYRPNVWTYTAKALFAQSEEDDLVTTRSFAALFRGSRALTKKLSFYGQYDYLHDHFAGIEQRHTIQAGPSYLVLDDALQYLRFDGGIGYQHEGRLGAEDSDSTVVSGGVTYRWQISATSLLAEELRATLPFNHTDEWKLDQSISLTAAITSILSLKISNIVRFVNAPVPGFESTDTVTSVAFVMKLRRPPLP